MHSSHRRSHPNPDPNPKPNKPDPNPILTKFGLKLVDCRSRQYASNVVSKNGKGGVDGECDDVDE